ncbi:hypothetical protein QQP08_000953 [Theobroma cacao]|nr:hypothetical protein QQP08_000953 [Theobroma cacao]
MLVADRGAWHSCSITNITFHGCCGEGRDIEDGRQMRARVKELKLGAETAWSTGGSCYNALAEMVKHRQKSL